MHEQACVQAAMAGEVRDVVVIGAGPAGMAAAIAAKRRGLDVLLLDEQPQVGGQIYRSITRTDRQREQILGPDYVHGRLLAEQLLAEQVECWSGAAVWQLDRDRVLHVLRNDKTVRIAAKSVVVATGAMERPFPIPGWTLPGVMTAGAAQILLKNASVVPEVPVVLAGCGPLLYLLTAQYIRAGVRIKAVLDTSAGTDWRLAMRHAASLLAGWGYVSKGLGLLREIKAAGIPFVKDVSGLEVLGENAAEGIAYSAGGKTQRIDCELVLLHQGVVPNTQISWSLRAEHRWDDEQLCWVPVLDEWGQTSIPGIFIAGDGAGIGGALVAELQGELAGMAVANALQPAGAQTGEAQRARIRRHLAIRPFLNRQYRPREVFRIPADQVIVCRCEEVTAGSIREQVQLGCVGPNQTKSFSRCGMGPCQGRQCGLTVTELIAKTAQLPPQEVGYYRIRPPLKSLTLAQLAAGS
jgi:NADPH-dependent 2,4-dienoyl-CoA reductase/sulfur reductase-like enzyme